MKRKLLVFLLCAALLCAMSVTAFADMGPKPSVRVTLNGLPEGPVYGTLLSERDSTGPASAWKGDPTRAASHPGDEDYAIWKAFVDYEDPDGYWFLQEWWDCAGSRLNWTYYPPTPFKLLLYFPESGTFVSSGIYERYAFDSYFTARLTDGALTLNTSYQFLPELWGLVCRMALTMAVELAVGLLFWPRKKPVFGLLIWVNLLTQLGLNLALNVYAYYNGTFILIYGLVYFLLELAVMVIEGLILLRKMPKALGGEVPAGRVPTYALVSNLCSFVLGVLLVRRIPWMF